MKRPALYLMIGMSWITPGVVWADSVTLKTGEVLQGKVLRETADSVVMEYRFSPTISDERTIARSDIQKIQREQPDAKAFADLQKIEAPATALDGNGYDEIIQGKFQPFLKEFAYSAHTSAVRAKIAAFEKEKQRIEAGEIKLEGRWIAANEVAAEAYQLDARRAYEAMQRQADAADLVGELNAFAEFEKKWPLSAAYPDAVELTRQTLLKLDGLLTHHLRNFPFQEEQRKTALQRVPAEQRPHLENAQKRDLENATAAVTASKTAGKFAQYSLLIQTSMVELQTAGRTEYKRLEAINVKPMQQAVADAQLTARQIEQKQLALADASLKNAEASWPQLESLPRLKAYLEQVKAAALAGSDAQAKAVEDAADLKKKEAEAQSKTP